MLMSVGVLWDCRREEFEVYQADDCLALRARLQEADRVCTYNGLRFDLPVLWRRRRADVLWRPPWPLLTQDDLLARIWARLRRRQKGWKLDDVARATLGRGKTG